MGMIKYNESTIIDVRNKIDTCNEQILESLNKIYEETNNIGKILNTPRANKNMAVFLEYLNERINYVHNSKDKLNRKLTIVENEYRAYLDEVSQMVGDNNV